MNYIKSLNEPDLCQLILQTKKELFLVMPLIQPQLIKAIHALYTNSDGKVAINLGMDFAPETFRQGYGEVEAYDAAQLKPYNCLNIQDNRISFIISDEIAFFLFIESRYLIPAEKETINAVTIDPTSIVRLKHHFFKSLEKKDLEDQLANAIIDESIRIKNVEKEFEAPGTIISSVINNKIIDEVQKGLLKNPPIQPDYKRIVEYFSTKFQYVKLIFKGANLQSKKVELPQNALPVNDPDLRRRLETKLNLFNTNDGKIVFPQLEILNEKVKEIRKLYLVPLKIREENLLEMIKKQDFEKEVNDLEQEITNISNKILYEIDKKIHETKASLFNELTAFYIDNPKLISENNLFLNADKDYRKAEAQNIANEIIHKIKWPKAFQLTSQMKLTLQFSNIAFEDLSNQALLNELVERKVITEADKTSLAVFSKGIAVRKQ
jgi:hypothetical protein